MYVKNMKVQEIKILSNLKKNNKVNVAALALTAALSFGAVGLATTNAFAATDGNVQLASSDLSGSVVPVNTNGLVAAGGVATVRATVLPVDVRTVRATWNAVVQVNGENVTITNNFLVNQTSTNGFTGAAELSATLPRTATLNNASLNVVGAVVTVEVWAGTSWTIVGEATFTVGDTRPDWQQPHRAYLLRGESLNPGEWLISPNGQYGLTVQATDGNVVLYRLNPNTTTNEITIVQALAATNQTHNEFFNAPSVLVLQATDGNLVQYLGGLPGDGNTAAQAVAWTGTGAGQALFVQNDGNVVLYSQGDLQRPLAPVWARTGLTQNNVGGQAGVRPDTLETNAGHSPNNFFELNIR